MLARAVAGFGGWALLVGALIAGGTSAAAPADPPAVLSAQAGTLSPVLLRSWVASPTSLPDADPGIVGYLDPIDIDASGRVLVSASREYRPAGGVMRFSPDGLFLDRMSVGASSGGWERGGVGNGVAAAPDGSTYLAHCTSGRVSRFLPDGTYDRALPVPYTGGGVNQCRTSDVAVAPDGTVYALSDAGQKVYRLQSGSFQVLFGGEGSGPGQLSGAEEIAVGPDGTIYVAERLNARVSRFAPDGTPLGSWGGAGVLSSPTSIDVDEAGRVFVRESDRIVAFAPDGTLLGSWPTGSLNPYSVAAHVDGTGLIHLYIAGNGGQAGNYRIYEYVVPTAPVARVTLTAGAATATVGSTIHLQAQVDNIGPTPLSGVHLTASGLPGCAGPVPDLAPGGSQTVTCDHVVTDADIGSYHRRVSVDTDQTAPSSSTPVWVEVLPPEVTRWGGTGSAPGQLSGGGGLAVAGDVYVADCGNNRVQRFTPDGTFVLAWGTAGSGDGQFACPIDVATSHGEVLVLDRDNRRVQRFTADGTFLEAWSTTTTAPGLPTSIDVDGTGDVFVTDAEDPVYGPPCHDEGGQQVCTTYPPDDNNLVRRFSAHGTPLGSWGGGQPYYRLHGVFATADGRIDVLNSIDLLVRTAAGASLASVPGIRGSDVVEDDDGNVFVTDGTTGVRKFSPGLTPLASWSLAPGPLAISANGQLYVHSGDTIIRYATEPPPAPTGLGGTVVEDGSGHTIGGAWVAVLRSSDFALAATAVADGDGTFAAEVPAGSYFVYVIDPSGAHRSGFDGAPTPVAVAAGAMTEDDPSLPALTGTVEGTVTDGDGGPPLSGAWVLGLNGATGAPERAVRADGSGRFLLQGLVPGPHLLVFLDATGAHAPEFFPHAPDASAATPVSVVGGATTTVTGSPPAQVAAPGGAALTGTVTATSGGPLAGVGVIALRASDFRFAGGAVTDGSGHYGLDVAPGGYKLFFLDGTGRYGAEWHDNRPYNGLAQASSVAAPATTDATLDPTTGGIAGNVTDGPSGDPLPGAWVVAIGPTGIAGGAVVATDGSYTVPALAAGVYRVTVLDTSGGRPQEYYDDSSDYTGAAPVVVTNGATTAVDVALG